MLFTVLWLRGLHTTVAALHQLRGFLPQMFQTTGKVIKNFSVFATLQPAIVQSLAVRVSFFHPLVRLLLANI